MKIISLVLLFAVSISSLAFSAETTKPSKGSGVGGWRESYGGDATILEFKYFAKEVAYVLKTQGFTNSFGFNINNFSIAVDASNVICADDLQLDGVSKDAINYPHETPQRIMLNCEKWKKFSPQEKYMLAIHEFLPLIGIIDTTYQYTSEIYVFFNISKSGSNQTLQMLMDAALDCNETNFDDFVTRNGNVFMLSIFRLNALHTATVSGCLPIMRKLIDLGVPYQDSSSLTPAAHYMLIQYSFNSPTTNAKHRAVMSLKMLVENWPTIPSMGFPNLNWSTQGNFIHFPKECYKDSTIMHLAADQCKYNANFCDVPFYRSLAKLGFSLDTKNACGKTTRSLLKEAGAVLE